MKSQPSILRPALELEPGDTFYRGDVLVRVLRKREPTWDMFGTDLFKFWCSRADTDAEGWMTFGPSGVVVVQKEE